ncbi:MAG TPA: T9SS type A sorting domain-containing protein [Ignavibacteriales bacterium]|nr:T9SS type A sorting domain-containing protein [Ignavibacteriales bacterium]
MMKRLLFVVTMLVAFSATSFSQWTLTPFGKDIDTLKGSNSGAHGIAVDPDGKIWVAQYNVTAAFRDSMFVADSNKYFKTLPVLVFNPDGSPASISPVRSWKDASGKVLPLWFGANTGLNTDFRGNIILSQGKTVVKFNYKTGESMGTYLGKAGLTRCAADTVGNVYVSYTLPGNPVEMLDSNLAYVENSIDVMPGYGRTLEVSKDGMTLYATRYSLNLTYIYQKPDQYQSFALKDSVFIGWAVEGIGWNPVNKLLYVSAGSYLNAPTGAYGPLQQDRFVTKGTYYGVRTTDWKVLDSLSWKYTEPFLGNDLAERNRGIAFSKDGKTAYIIQFNASAVPVLQRYTTQSLQTGVKKENAVVENYSLSQNYPNPFNPSTEIKFSIAKDGFVSLKVYDILGKEVSSLVNGQMTKGSYSVRVDGQNLTSGIYIYQLNANGVMLSRKMTLMK